MDRTANPDFEAILKRIADKKEQEWRERNTTGRLYVSLKDSAEKQGVEFSIKDKFGPIETFKYGDQQATFTHHLAEGGVGESSGQIKDFVECYHYKRNDWWKKALEATQTNFEFQDTPVALAGCDITPNWRELFAPREIIEKYGLAPADDIKKKREMTDWINEEVSKLLKDHLLPHFGLRTYDGALRMVPLTEEAKATHTEDNAVYNQVLTKIQDIIPQLEVLYQLKSKQIKDN